MPHYRARWIVPISQPPIRDGWVRVERGRVVALGPHRRGERAAPDDIDLGSVVVLPGLVNAHTHLELSWMRGRIPETDRFSDWVRRLIAIRQGRNEAVDPEAQSAIRESIAEAKRCGTALLGDISNTLASAIPLARSDVAAVVFRELIGFKSDNVAMLAEAAFRELAALPKNGMIRYALAPHAPYSVSPLLFGAINSALMREPFTPCSVHLGESAEEVEFLQSGGGAWRRLLEDLGAWDPSWVAPKCDPVEYLDRMGFVNDRLLAVHGVQLQPRALDHLAKRGATLVTCPRGNVLTGAGTPPVSAFYSARVRVAVGTDSLASVPDLNLFSELAELRRLAPEVAASSILDSATIIGARALGFDADFGSIDPGKRAKLIAVDISSVRGDVEEFLLAGIQPDQIRWLA